MDYLWLLLAFAFAQGKAEKNTRIEMEKIILKSLAPDMIDDLHSEMVEVKNRTYISGLLRLKRTLDQFKFRSIMDLRKENNKTQRLYDVVVDACQFFRGTHKSQLFNMFLKSLKRHLTGELVCPLKAVSID